METWVESAAQNPAVASARRLSESFAPSSDGCGRRCSNMSKSPQVRGIFQRNACGLLPVYGTLRPLNDRDRSSNRGGQEAAMSAPDRNIVLRAMALAGLIVFTTGYAGAQPITLRLGYGAAAEEPLWLLLAKPDLVSNYGKAYTLEGTRFQGSDKRAQAFEADAIDLASGSANGVIFAAAEGVMAKMIASLSRESSRGFSTTFYVKADSPIRSVDDLKGKTVGVNGFFTSGHLWLKTALEKHGLDESDLTITPIPFPAMQQSLEAGKIDLGMFPQPFAALAERQMKVRKLFDAKYGVPFDEELIVLIGKDEFLKRNAPAIRALLADLKQATKFYLEKPREARQLLIDAKMVRVTPDVYLAMNDYYHEPTMQVDVGALEKMQEGQIKAGFQKKSVDVKSLVDLGYLEK
jgi:ABC-type nitrate/sulfonate/bicarbonate transport system substrate-binding protein